MKQQPGLPEALLSSVYYLIDPAGTFGANR